MRNCIDDKCPHYKGRGKRGCEMMPKAVVTDVMPQKFCPILSGAGLTMRLNYEVLEKYDPRLQWTVLKNARNFGIVD